MTKKKKKEPLELISEVAKALAPSFTFGIYDEDDIYQEAVLFGIECLDRHDPSISKLKTFLYTHIRNRLINFKRNNSSKRVPCSTCLTKSECKEPCKTYCSWYSKHTLDNPASLDMAKSLSQSDEPDVLDRIVEDEMIDKINMELPLQFRKDYRMFVDGIAITKKKRQALILKLREILKEWQDEENQPPQNTQV